MMTVARLLLVSRCFALQGSCEVDRQIPGRTIPDTSDFTTDEWKEAVPQRNKHDSLPVMPLAGSSDSLVEEGVRRRRQIPVSLVPGFRSMQVKQSSTANSTVTVLDRSGSLWSLLGAVVGVGVLRSK